MSGSIKILTIILMIRIYLVNCAPRQNCKNQKNNEVNCCELPISDLLSKHYGDCRAELESKQNVLNKFTEQWCLDECIFVKLRFFKDGKFNNHALLEVVIEQFNISKPFWEPLVLTSFDYCSTEAQQQEIELNKLLEQQPFELAKSNCSIMPGFVVKCMSVYLTKACPNSEWYGSRDCEEYKKFLEMCPNQLIPAEYL